MSTAHTLELINVHKSFHDGESSLHVLEGINLQLAAGDSVALSGASGCGKSTLMQIAAGLEQPDQGEVLIRGESLVNHSEKQLAELRRRHLGFVFQQFNLIPGLNVKSNLLFQRRLNRLADSDDWVDALIAGLQLEKLLKRPVEVLSGGQQQRVAIARALAHRPAMVFADEPTGNLHDSLSRQVMDLLIRLVNEAGSSLLLVTHNLEMADYASRQFQLESGRLVSLEPVPGHTG